MSRPLKHASLNIRLIQTREALMNNFRPILNDAGVTDQQWRIIRLLAESGTLDFQELAAKACILRPSLTGILTRLEKSGFLVRLKPSNDQRRVFLKLTEAGEKMYIDTCSRVDDCYDLIEAKWSKAKIEQLHELLADFCQCMNQETEKAE